jgi:hypothetical protein
LGQGFLFASYWLVARRSGYRVCPLNGQGRLIAIQTTQRYETETQKHAAM